MRQVTPGLAPNGGMRAVDGTPMDCRTPKAIGRDIKAGYDLLEAGNGYDNHYALAMEKPNEVVPNARIKNPKSGRALEAWSDEPGIELDSGNFLDGETPRDLGKGATGYPFRSAFCLEPSRFPDSPNHSGLPTTALKPGEWYSGTIVYRLSADKKQA